MEQEQKKGLGGLSAQQIMRKLETTYPIQPPSPLTFPTSTIKKPSFKQIEIDLHPLLLTVQTGENAASRIAKAFAVSSFIAKIKPKRLIQPKISLESFQTEVLMVQPSQIEKVMERMGEITVPTPKQKTVSTVKVKTPEITIQEPKITFATPTVPPLQVETPKPPPPPKLPEFKTPKTKKKIKEPFGYWYPKEWKELINVEKAIKNLEALFK